MRLLREPLLHFLVLGLLLFGAYDWLQGGARKPEGEIVVSRGELQSIEAQFQRARNRPPTASERKALVDTWVREEIFYREGLAMGLDRDDAIVRRRVAQKLEFIVDGAAAAPPTTAEMQQWLDANAEKYAVEPRYTFRQVFFDVERHGERLDVVSAAARRAIDAGKEPTGDPTLLPVTMTRARESEVRRIFGAQFADALKAAPADSWQGPLRSGFGAHLVKLGVKEAGRNAALDEVRSEVERDLMFARAARANAAYFEKLRARYTVRVHANEIAKP